MKYLKHLWSACYIVPLLLSGNLLTGQPAAILTTSYGNKPSLDNMSRGLDYSACAKYAVQRVYGNALHQVVVPDWNALFPGLTQTSYQDNYFELGCAASGFHGYFDPFRWRDDRIQSVGGVDVTGAPGAHLLTEVDNFPVEVANRTAACFQIVIPADGYATFNWNATGGSISPAPLLLRHNSQPVALLRATIRTPYLRAGDTLAFQLANPQTQGLIVWIRNFTFHSNAQSILERNWTMQCQYQPAFSFRQLIAVERPNFADVRLPDNPSELPQGLHPTEMGFPYIDIDGNPNTKNDRILLDGPSSLFPTEWRDEYTEEGNKLVLIRHWLIQDPCGDNRLEGIQRFVIPDALLLPQSDPYRSMTYPADDISFLF